jgi:hypothetical protein
VPIVFRWIEWNLDKVAKHGCTVSEVERVASNPPRGYPRKSGDDKLTVVGRGQGDRLVQVVYLVDDDGSLFVIHAMPLTTRRRRGGR